MKSDLHAFVEIRIKVFIVGFLMFLWQSLEVLKQKMIKQQQTTSKLEEQKQHYYLDVITKRRCHLHIVIGARYNCAPLCIRRFVHCKKLKEGTINLELCPFTRSFFDYC